MKSSAYAGLIAVVLGAMGYEVWEARQESQGAAQVARGAVADAAFLDRERKKLEDKVEDLKAHLLQLQLENDLRAARR